jgi:hypothetical protein
MPEIANPHQKVTLDEILWTEDNKRGMQSTHQNLGPLVGSASHMHNTAAAGFGMQKINHYESQ